MNPTSCGIAISDKAEHNTIAFNYIINSKQFGICTTGEERNSFCSNTINSTNGRSVGILSQKVLNDAYKNNFNTS